jgi:ribosomal protein S12 methylthiotransferase accessory factor
MAAGATEAAVTVGLIGDSAVVSGAESALSALGIDHRRVESVDDVDRAIVAGPWDDRERFETADDRFREGGSVSTEPAPAWVAVEIGGVGGREASVSAAVTALGGPIGCYRCLRDRRASTAAVTDDSAEAEGPDGDEPRTESADTPQTAIAPADAHLAGVVAARALCGRDGEGDADAGTSPAAFGRTVELPWRERNWLPVPTCTQCGGRPDRSIALSHAERSLEDALARAERALEERLGLLTTVGERESFPAPYYVAQTAETTVFSDADAADFAAGVAADWNPAFMKALGEGLERYCAGVYRTDWFTTATASAVAERTGAAVVEPSAFVTGSAAADSSAERHWIAGRSLAADEPAVLPADRVQFPGPGDGGGITTGLALGNATVEAIRGGLSEVVERDATMCTWYSTIDPVGLESDDPTVGALTRRARSEDLSVSLSLSTVDVDVPVVTAALHRDDPWPRFAVGSGASIDPDAAARSALAEAIQNWMELRAMGRERASEEEPTLVTFADDPGRADGFVDPDVAIHADDLIDGILPAGRDALEALVDRVSDAGLSPYAARITTDDVAALGFEAVRVVVPRAQPLFVGEPVFGERARSVPESFGEEPRLEREHHPYP